MSNLGKGEALFCLIALFALISSSKSEQQPSISNPTNSVAFHSLFPPPPPSLSPTQQPMVMRAWRCHGRSQKELVDNLTMAKIIQSPAVRDAMYAVDRKNYAKSEFSEAAYADAPQPIGLGQTISAPHMHAHALEEMLPYMEHSTSDELSILDVGCGSGYLTAALGRLVDSKKPILNKSGKVYGMDVYSDLVEMTLRNIEKGDGDLISRGVVSVTVGDGWKGLPEQSPFDAIHVGAAANKFPEQLMMQLRVGGVLVVPVGPEGGAQALYKVEKVAQNDKYRIEDFKITNLLGVRYVPLVHP